MDVVGPDGLGVWHGVAGPDGLGVWHGVVGPDGLGVWHEGWYMYVCIYVAL